MPNSELGLTFCVQDPAVLCIPHPGSLLWTSGPALPSSLVLPEMPPGHLAGSVPRRVGFPFIIRKLGSLRFLLGK